MLKQNPAYCHAGGAPAADQKTPLVRQKAVRRDAAGSIDWAKTRFPDKTPSGRYADMKTATTKYGTLAGVEEHGYTVFKGIPYAKPPVGPLRFRAPQEPDAWSGVLCADRFPHCAVQPLNDGTDFYGKEFYSNPAFRYQPSEDCLYLNIWTPARTDMERLPVAFWIHGGAYSGGNGAEIEFDGEAFCRHHVILVTINYRLGPLGFLAHPWLSEESENHVSGNYGILDQIAALRWVRDNIEAFGGDPERVMVFGQSAGCMSTQTLLSSPLTDGMIRSAVLQSGGGYCSPLLMDKTLSDAEREGKEMLALASVPSLEALRKLTPAQINQAANLYMAVLMKRMQETGKFTLPFAPVIDGYVLPLGYNETVRTGRLRNVPMIIGCCKNDMSAPGSGDTALADMLLNSAVGLAEIQADLGRKDVYVYRFERQMPGDDAGAFHSSELWYMFGTWRRCWRPLTWADGRLSEKMVSYWTNFCRSGDPNGAAVPAWPAYKRDAPYMMKFDIS